MKPLPMLMPVSLPIAQHSERFPVRRVFCVGRNYADHAIEMGATGREPPFFFMKPIDALFSVPADTETFWPYPMATHDLHHEVELVVALHRGGRELSLEAASEAIWGYAIGLDMTRRDRQAEMKAQGKSWEIGKAFDAAAPIGPLVPVAEGPALTEGQIELRVNGELRQSGNLASLIWSIPEVIAELSKAWEVKPGDLIYTGTPAGVGRVRSGDLLEASFPGLPGFKLRVK